MCRGSTMSILEKEIEKKFCADVELAGGMTVKFSDPSRKGAPDRLVIGDPIDWFYFVEFKTHTGKLAPLHFDYAKKLEGHMVDVYLIDSVEKFDAFRVQRCAENPKLHQFLLRYSFS